jgi:hypothetical protein
LTGIDCPGIKRNKYIGIQNKQGGQKAVFFNQSGELIAKSHL